MPRELSESAAFVLLAKRRRRLALRILQESSGPVSAIEIARRIGNRECEDPSADDFSAVYLSLYHNHLPRLDDADVVSCDEREGTVRPDRNFDALVRVLEGATERDLPWADE